VEHLAFAAYAVFEWNMLVSCTKIQKKSCQQAPWHAVHILLTEKYRRPPTYMASETCGNQKGGCSQRTLFL
jgi:hypothetical protein